MRLIHLACLIVVLLLFVSLPADLAAQTTAPAPPPEVASGTIGQRAQSALGLVAFTFLAFALGRMRGARAIPWRVIVWGIVLQFAFAAIVLFVPRLLETVQNAVTALL